MSRHATRFNKRDANETVIVQAIEALGVEWHEAGPLDGWVFMGQWIPVEIKTKTGRLTDGQKAFIARCELDGRPYLEWRNANEAIECVRLYHQGLMYPMSLPKGAKSCQHP